MGFSFVLLFGTFLNQPSHAQETDDVRRNWLTAGIGLSGEHVKFSGSLAYQFDTHLVSLRMAWSGGVCPTCEDNDVFGDVAILYGRSTISDNFHASIAGGLGLAEGHEAASFENGFEGKDFPTSVGLAVQGQLFLDVSNSLGIGLYFFANINSQKNLFGTTLTLQLGRIR